jgi:hypothetical protein
MTLASSDIEAGKPCTHHWLLESPRGDTSRGVCKYCGEEREFAIEPKRSLHLTKRETTTTTTAR